MQATPFTFIHSALHVEAVPFIASYDLVKDVHWSPFEYYRNDNTALIVSGVGRMRTAAACASALTKIQYEHPGRHYIAINVGIAGADHPRGDLMYASQICDRASNRCYYPDILSNTPGKQVRLETFDAPVFDSSLLEIPGSISDMEASAFFETCRIFCSSASIHSFKIISDNFLKGQIESREAITKLISAHVDSILKFESNLRMIFERQPEPLLQMEKDLLKKICTLAQFSHAQSHDLLEIAASYKIIHKQIPPALWSWDLDARDHHQDRRSLYKELRSYFAAR